MRTKVIEWIKRYDMLHEDDTVVIGVSGGADSVCLLFLLCEIISQNGWNNKIEVVHINHKLREEASSDAEFVRKLCALFEERFGISLPCHIREFDVNGLSRELKISCEEAGRKVRYETFREVLGDRKGCIAVAHHKDDRAETMLLNLFRGTGLKGACGIQPVNEGIIRPLLCVTREEIENFAKKEGLDFVTDRTNLEDEYTRNKIRHHILDYAKKNICLSVTDNMGNAALQLEAAEDFIHNCTSEAWKRCVTFLEPDRLTLDISALRSEHPYIVDRVIYEAIVGVGGIKKDISAEHVKTVRGLLDKTGSKKADLPYDVIVKKEYNQLTLMKTHKKTGDEIRNSGRIFTRITEDFDMSQIPKETYTKWFDYDRISSVATLRFREEGDYLSINRDMQTKSLKEYLINEKVPKDQRDKIPVLADRNHIMWVVGMRISEYFKVTETTKRILEVKFERNSYEREYQSSVK